MRRIVIATIISAAALLCACSPPATAPKPEEVKTPPFVDDRAIRHVKVYVGGDALRVTVVRFMPPNGDEALLEITGTESELDSIVLPHEFVDDHYETTVRGKPYWTMRKTSEDGKWDVWVMGDAHEVSYNENESTAIDGTELVRRHHEHVAAGIIEGLQRFNRKDREQGNEDSLTRLHDLLVRDCEVSVRTQIEWSTVDDDLLKELSISGYCGHVSSAMQTLCNRESSFKSVLRDRIKKINCRFGGDVGFDLNDDGVITWSVNREGTNLGQVSLIALLRNVTVNPTVLDTGRGHYLLVDPVALFDNVKDPKLYFGDDKVVHEQRPKPHHHGFRHGGMWAPREDHQTKIELDEGAWSLTCGDRDVALTEVTEKKRTDLLATMEMKGPLWEYEPYLLARDDLGNYYYVDQLRDGGKGFRVFRGQKGLLKLTRLVNIVEDAQGEIFATKVGSLRLVIDGSSDKTAWWLKGDKKISLVTVPISLSQKLIYSELGVYDGDDLGTPCDHY